MDRGLVRFSSLLLVAVFALSACAFDHSDVATKAKTKLIGMKKEQVLACMGPANKKAQEGETEVWSYKSTNGEHDTASASQKLSSTTTFSGSEGYKYFCTVNIVMTNGTVAAVHYNGPRGGWLTEDEQCAFAVEHCVE